MTNAVKRIMIKAIKARLAAGEELEVIMDSYPKLTAEERAELIAAVSE